MSSSRRSTTTAEDAPVSILLKLSSLWGALILMTIPILMVFLSLTLPAPVALKTNIVVAALYVLVSIGNVADETWVFIWLGSAIEAVLLLAIVRYAWR